ncbi:MAG: hypothetical protein ACFCVK_22695 [Acidimicrobiales bacterium]
MTSLAADVDLQRVNKLLWRYRPCLERFEFLLEMQLMVAASGRQDWLVQLADLLDDVATLVSTLDLERETVLGTGITLSELADGAPEPWPEILAEQQAYLAATTARIGRLRHRNIQALEEGAAGLSKLLEAIAEAAGQPLATTDSYGGDGRRRPDGAAGVLFDGKA